MNQILYDEIIPRISSNIEVSSRNDEYIVTLLDSNFHLKVSSNLFNLLQCVDNNKTICQIVDNYNSTFQNQIDSKIAYELLFKKLGHYNIIENEENNFKPSKTPSYLKLSTIIINAKVAKTLSSPFLFLFSNRIMICLIPICLIIITATIITDYNEILGNLKEISSENIVLYIVFMTISTLFHELGHATATYKFGGEHSGIGIGFYLFTPVMFADVSSAWKFSVNKRIIVNLAGLYFELLFTVILILIAFITKTNSFMLISIGILVRTLYNLNPFFRTDGYWILSDAIRIPNLRKTSDALLQKAIKFNNSRKFSKKEYALIIYAFLSNTFILFFLFYLFVINPNSLLSFPVDIYSHIKNLITNKTDIDIIGFAPFITPVIFYFLIIRLSYIYIKKLKQYAITKKL
jgi:putative peptide zinc metalloprotease protein